MDGVKVLSSRRASYVHDVTLSWTHPLVVSNMSKFNGLGRGTSGVASGQCNHLSTVAAVHLDLHLGSCIHE